MYLPEDEHEAKYQSNKDVKRWCKGKQGVHHKPVTVKRGRWSCNWYVSLGRPFYSCSHESQCSVCGRILRWRIDNDECPEIGRATMEHDRRPFDIDDFYAQND